MNQNESTIRTYMAIMAERDGAIRERNIALEERKRAFSERDMAMLERDAAIAEWKYVIQERDEAISALSELKEIKYDESVMPGPVCTCTGSPQPCYRWGKDGWQSACCTTTISMYPLPPLSDKSYTRVGGRKMSGGAFNKLLTRVAHEGYNLFTPLDLKDHWAKHGTDRYNTAK